MTILKTRYVCGRILCPGVLLAGSVFLLGCQLASNSVRSTRGPAEETVNAGVVAPQRSAPPKAIVQQPVTPPREVVERPPVRTEEPIRLRPVPQASPSDRAVTILTESSRSDWPQLRANALEALISDPRLLREEVLAGLVDENRGVRFVAAMSIARAETCELAPFVEPLLTDSSQSVRAAAIYALASCGLDVDPTPLASMAFATDPEVRANAYLVLGLLGNESARALIRSSLGTSLGLVDPVRVRLVDLQAAAALVRLGDHEEIEPIRAALFAPVEQAEITALAIQLLASLKDEGARQMLVRLVEAPSDEARPPEIRLAAAEAIAQLGANDPKPLIRLASEYQESPDAATRAQVASLLSAADDATAMAMLTDLMGDPDALVRLAAAGSLLSLEAQNGSEKGESSSAQASVH